VELVVASLRAGGRLVHVGAGTSGRLGVLDAAECPPTFTSPPGQVVGVIAGGPEALVRAVEAAPDDAAAARRAQGQLAEVAACSPPEVDGEGLIRRMGALALGAAVAGEGDVPQQLAQLLPRDLGLLLMGAAGAAPPGSLPARGERVH
jgi:hypothetical protein